MDFRKLAAEFLGTMVLVVVAVGVATESFGFKLFGLSYTAGVVATAFAFGLVLVALVYAIGPISGCHVNPAVTLGFIASGRMKLAEGVAYLVAQFAGGIVGAYLLYWMFTTSPLYQKSVQGLGTDGYGKESHLFVSQWGAFLIEVVLTAIFVLVVLFATHKAAIQGAAGVAIGFGLVMVHLIGIPLTGTSVNPARSLGPALVVGGTALSQVWLFIVAPLVGALVAAIIHLLLAERSGARAGRNTGSGGATGAGVKRASPATVGSMDLTEALAFVRARQQGVLATIRTNGRPQLSNIMYVPGEGDTFLISVTDSRAKTANLRRDPRASLYVPGDTFWQYVVIEAAAELSPVAADPHDATVDLLVEYYRSGPGEHPDWEEYRSRHGQRRADCADPAARARLRHGGARVERRARFVWGISRPAGVPAPAPAPGRARVAPWARAQARRATPRPAARGRARAPRPPWRRPARRRRA